MTEETLPACPQCQSEYTYLDGHMYVCPMCGYEWSATASEDASSEEEAGTVFRDASGNVLQDGDDVTIIKTLKVKGGTDIKVGTKVKGIRLLESPVNGHDIDAKVPGQGQMYLKTSVVKKA